MSKKRLLPFRGVRYDDPSPDAGDGVVDISNVIAPIEPDAWTHNPSSFSSELLRAKPSTYWDSWLESGLLAQDDEPILYLYRVGWRDINGLPRQGAGVYGYVDGEYTGPSIVPTLIPVDEPAFSELLTPTGSPLTRATDSIGRHYRLWPIMQTGIINAIADAVLIPTSANGLVTASSDNIYPPLGLVFGPVASN